MAPITISAAAYGRLPAPVRALFQEAEDGSYLYKIPAHTTCDNCGAKTAVR